MKTEEGIRKDLEASGYIDVGSDVNLSYGRRFVKEIEVSIYDTIEIVDLDSATGADGLLLVEARTTCFGFMKKKDWKSVFECMDTKSYIKGIEDKQIARCALAWDIISYGIADPRGYGNSYTVIHFERPNKEQDYQGWEPDSDYGWGWQALRKAVNWAIDL